MRDQKAIEYDGVVSPLRDEPNAFKRQCFRDGWDAAIAAMPDMAQLKWWEPRQDNNYTHGAKTIFGTYYVGQCGGRSNAHAEFFHESGDIEQYLGPDRGSVIEAQQDARRHYASRILSAFGITEGEM